MLSEENNLEKILRRAADEPAHRPEFYRVLMESQVFLLGSTDEAVQNGKVNLKAGDKIQIQHWEKPDGAPVVPFFSSLDALQRSIQSEESYLALPARTLFEITRGATLFLNPKSDYGKEFLPHEVEQLLAGGLSREPEQRVVEKDTRVLLGQPAHYPDNMVASLTLLLAKHGNVNKAYLALMHNPSLDEKPHLIIGIDADGDGEKVMKEAGNVAGDTSPDGEPVDIYRVNKRDDGLSQYFISQTTPFYQRTWRTRLKAWWGRSKS
ncbi:enhanced serine sensitivity protein SseB [Dickeya chrysanthemi]|uniref:enhanced serine sensitivity protein SseB n=1 Tax=Dickeya chrysanthemi TaxID=556 RepID=UPI000532F8B8|nr:enhanced serine sensitivity protein SseB [Dickeya chrysanthemi]